MLLLEHLVGKKASQGMTVLIAVISGIFLTIFGGISYIPIIMLGTLFKKPFLRHNLDLSNLSRTCEDTGTMFIACVPWASSGVYYHGVFGVSVLTFAPWIIISFICPVLAVIYGYTGFGLWYEKDIARGGKASVGRTGSRGFRYRVGVL